MNDLKYLFLEIFFKFSIEGIFCYGVYFYYHIRPAPFEDREDRMFVFVLGYWAGEGLLFWGRGGWQSVIF